jgi:hypothetical protein
MGDKTSYRRLDEDKQSEGSEHRVWSSDGRNNKGLGNTDEKGSTDAISELPDVRV